MKERIGLYNHIPFCQKKCHYCDFLTFVDMEDKMDEYIDYLVKEMALYHGRYQLDTIYFGGGTPSYLAAEQMAKIMESISKHFEILPDCEISIEMNPESVTKEKVETYLKYGFNRFSMGVQSFDNATLRMMGRLHDRQKVYEKVALLKELGVEKLGIDLMFGNPKQDMAVLKHDIELAMQLPINHISYYSLMIKENTPFQRWVLTGQMRVLDDEIERKMYHYIQSELAKHGFHQYEISNFAKGEVESRHNKKYWQLENYLGLGLGASSNIDLVRFVNHRRFADYYGMIDQGKFPIQISERLSVEDREKEYIMLNLRLLEGFAFQAINQRFQINFLEKYQDVLTKHKKLGLIDYDHERIWFTEKGLDMGNQFYLDII
ncbi:radical SAM family heme chaperone HemW [Facklamia miroungae]|uniref:Heme chaperone HemW n=1 Tax=Facklamia miroungae TaxID=120956 RepID=A0A1G7QIM1_9LACT|nr:radical SAM family heme chaperone HemW [Facklamia miroungae]NKZ28954.1 radical SAM family heme chaperone HemW [Facklamia miroungae]SDF98326.1 oxygen-independent coproporphyrinogen-3 oxidase [Facklamia miroungae]